MFMGPFEQGNDDSPDNCETCKGRLAAERKRMQTAKV
jgi:hypothetical protein